MNKLLPFHKIGNIRIHTGAYEKIYFPDPELRNKYYHVGWYLNNDAIFYSTRRANFGVEILEEMAQKYEKSNN